MYKLLSEVQYRGKYKVPEGLTRIKATKHDDNDLEEFLSNALTHPKNYRVLDVLVVPTDAKKPYRLIQAMRPGT